MNSKWSEFRPSKTLWFWSSAGCVVLTMVVGFTLGGWVTGGTATKMAQSAQYDARAQLAAEVCVANFTSSDGFAASLSKLKETSSWSQDDFVADGGWVTLNGMDRPIDGAAALCASRLADMATPSASKASSEPESATKG